MSFDPRALDPEAIASDDPNNLGELLQELRVLLQGAQLLAGFLVVLPFSAGFARIRGGEKTVYLVTLLCTMTSLILFSAPAIHHRLQRPLVNRIQFKNAASRTMLAGALPLSIALILAVQLASSEVLGVVGASVVAVAIGTLLIGVWWILPLLYRNRLPAKNA